MHAVNNPDCASLLRAMADDTRLEILRQLLGGPKRVAEINQVLQVEQSLLSHHLKVLRESGLVVSSRVGKSVSYELKADSGQEGTLNLGCCSLQFR